jgi:head-tail adaptor
MQPSGTFRDVATFQKRPTTKDAYGQMSGALANITGQIDVPINLEDLAGHELYKAQSIVAGVTARFTRWGYPGWRSELTPDCRIVCNGRIFDVKYIVNPDGIDKQLSILAVEIVK